MFLFTIRYCPLSDKKCRMTCLYLTSLMPRVNYFLKTSSYESEPLIGDNATFHSSNPSLSHHLRCLVNDSFGLFGSVCFGWTPIVRPRRSAICSRLLLVSRIDFPEDVANLG